MVSTWIAARNDANVDRCITFDHFRRPRHICATLCGSVCVAHEDGKYLEYTRHGSLRSGSNIGDDDSDIRSDNSGDLHAIFFDYHKCCVLSLWIRDIVKRCQAKIDGGSTESEICLRLVAGATSNGKGAYIHTSLVDDYLVVSPQVIFPKVACGCSSPIISEVRLGPFENHTLDSLSSLLSVIAPILVAPPIPNPLGNEISLPAPVLASVKADKSITKKSFPRTSSPVPATPSTPVYEQASPRNPILLLGFETNKCHDIIVRLPLLPDELRTTTVAHLLDFAATISPSERDYRYNPCPLLSQPLQERSQLLKIGSNLPKAATDIVLLYEQDRIVPNTVTLSSLLEEDPSSYSDPSRQHVAILRAPRFLRFSRPFHSSLRHIRSQARKSCNEAIKHQWYHEVA